MGSTINKPLFVGYKKIDLRIINKFMYVGSRGLWLLIF